LTQQDRLAAKMLADTLVQRLKIWIVVYHLPIVNGDIPAQVLFDQLRMQLAKCLGFGFDFIPLKLAQVGTDGVFQ
jgi:hypothetical protein